MKVEPFSNGKLLRDFWAENFLKKLVLTQKGQKGIGPVNVLLHALNPISATST